jgi:hypothetical protein
LFANRHDIRKLEVDTMILQPVVGELHSAIAVDYDYHNKVVYWSDSHEEKIMRSVRKYKSVVVGDAETLHVIL